MNYECEKIIIVSIKATLTALKRLDKMSTEQKWMLD